MNAPQTIREASGVDALGMAIDATSEEDLRKALGQILSLWGRVDILLNAPGINSGTPFFEITEEEWDRILSVNLKSMFLACQIFGKEMVDRGEGGSVINISSASSGPPLSKVFTYSVTKAGVNNLTQFLAREWAPNGRPGQCDRSGILSGRAEPQAPDRGTHRLDHGPHARWLDSVRPTSSPGRRCGWPRRAASGFVTGSIVRVDGGFTAMTI